MRVVKDTFIYLYLFCSLKTEPSSLGLNAALKSICFQKEVPDGNAFGLPAAVMNPSLIGAILERLNFSDGVYAANITSIL